MRQAFAAQYLFTIGELFLVKTNLSFMTSLKIYLQQSHRFQEFFHSDKSAKEQATLINAQPLAQRYKAKQVLRQQLNNVNQTFDFLLFMWFLDF